MVDLNVRMRILSGRLIEQMDKDPEYSKKIGLENTSVFCEERNINEINSLKKGVNKHA